MTDNRSNPAEVMPQQQHSVGHASPPPPAPSSASTQLEQHQQQQQQQQEVSPPRGPRTLLLRRSENGFGFTLRHFIVYPPESCCMLPGHERTKIDEPMDTIFVKQVRENSPASEAGLRTGDRVVSVDGKPTRGEQYASVVQRIQQAGPWLRLLVVSKEDDILQRYFGETAHNPETNQRPRRSPDRLTQKQRRSISMIPGPSAPSRQSWVCSLPGTENQQSASSSPYPVEQRYNDQAMPAGCKMPAMTGSTNSSSLQRRPLQDSRNQESIYERPDDRSSRRSRDTSSPNLQSYCSSLDSRYDLYDRTRPESIYSRPSNEQLYDRIKDPIYERVRAGEANTLHDKDLHQARYPVSRAEPQVPIYRPSRRVVARRASEGSQTTGSNRDSDVPSFGSIDALRSNEPGSRLSMDSRRDSSPASKDSVSSSMSYGSNSTLTGNECSDDSVIMTRLRKSFEQKEEFLRRPSHPIGMYLPEDPARRQSSNQTVIQREFYARPQKLQKQVWPPTDQRQQSPTRNSSLERTKPPSTIGPRSNSAGNGTSNGASHNEDRSSNEDIHQQQLTSRERFYSSLYENAYGKENHLNYHAGGKASVTSSRVSAPNKPSFVTTLSRIHENVTAGSVIQQQQQQQSNDLRNGTSSLPSSPGPDKKSADKFPVPPQGLQIVSKRAKQFESGRLLSDDDEPASDRTSLYKSELSRLTNKRSVPNVAVRKREFESKAESRETRRIPARESKSLDAGRGLSGNRIIPIGSKYIHCEPPAGYRETKEIPSNETETVRLRARSNSAESWEAVNGLSRRSTRHTWQTEPEEENERQDKQQPSENDLGNKKRQESYLQVVRNQLEWDPRYHATTERPIDESSSKELKPTKVIEMLSKPESHVVPKVTVSPPANQPRPNQLDIPNPSRPLECDHPHQHETEHHQHHQHHQHHRHQPDDTINLAEEVLAPSNGTANNGVVLRRQKNAQLNDEDRATRRVSYLKATWNERMHVDSDLDLSDSEPVHPHRSAHRRWRPPLFPSDITPLRRIFEDVTQVASLHRHSHRNSIGSSTHGSSGCGTPKDVEPVEREGSLHVKFTVLDGKRSTDRSWKQVWGVLRGPVLYFYKDRHSQSPSSSTESENAVQSVDVRCSSVDVAEDYTKRKHVLRVANPNAELLLQSDDAASMALWLRSLHKHAAAEKPSDATTSTSKQQAVPQTPGPNTPNSGSGNQSQRLSPLPSHKGIKKLTSFRNRSPTGQSPVNKTRKPSTTIEPLTSPKTKTWKGRVAKQFRRMQVGSPSSPTAQSPAEGATFKVPLELCPPSTFSEFVPLIVQMCTSIVEARGLEVVGIYRVPGNTAAISQLTDSVNKGFENINLQDPRWSDVNVISSLLKSFFRQLPDSLLTAELYPMFIDADKIEDPQRRMATVRKLLRDLPEHHFVTLKYLMFHLKKIVEHSEVNKMEAKNLAIVFGPTLVRASGSRDNMVTMVTDMSHQCRIVESLLNNVDWFFSDDDDDLSRLSVNLSLPAEGEVEPTSSTNHSLLLNNIQKVEGMREMVSAKDIVSSIISAANRKIQRRRKGQDEPENDDHDGDKNKGKEEAESLPTIRQSMALNERQCSVSEIVLMHENKSQSGHAIDRSDRSLSTPSSGSNGSPLNGGTSSSRSKYHSQPIQQQAVSSTSDSSRMSSDTGLSCHDSASTISSASNETKQSNDEVTIRTYAGLSATTQERIRRFEQETKAMLQRDQHRQRREAEKREEERRRIEMEWQLAKSEMENDDLLDNIVDTTVAPAYLNERLSNINERHARSRSTTRLTPLSIAVQQQPTARQKAQASNQLSNILGEKMNNSVIKKFKTDKEPSSDSLCLPPVRYGSLDSLHDVHTHSTPSPSQQHRGVPVDISDDGSDLLTSLTTTFDRKWRSLVNPSSQVVQVATESQSLITIPVNTNNVSSRKEDKHFNTIQSRHPKTEVYRDPSLHKSPVEKNYSYRVKNDAPEKDTDSTVAEESSKKKNKEATPDNDRNAISKKKDSNNSADNDSILDAAEKDEKTKNVENAASVETASDESRTRDNETDLSYTNKLEKFESLASTETRSRLKRSESLNKRSENTSSRLKRSESLNKHYDRLASPTNGKLKRSESLNKHSDRSESPNSKLKRSESLTKTEKTECNISKRRQSVRKESATKLKRKNGMPERSIKRRHTVGGTKDFDKIHWLDNKLQSEAERVIKSDCKPKKSQLRTSSPDLSSNRVNVADTSFLIEVSFRGPSKVVFNVTNARPQSLPDANLASKVLKIPLESHV